jgi:hypothetical protein
MVAAGCGERVTSEVAALFAAMSARAGQQAAGFCPTFASAVSSQN